ncbi:hypothetical protein AB0G60_02880 [Streptomyces angustmyceticus]|uniref:Uncharacterized protein n=1 Tax=Streptomyces angustmyceticus TaxID=285578 RepID=A0A5J4L6Q6_9ACTN|nr:hypothetical protein [Streptomyces angustmyceticus]UAL65606.1 hypothetical protein K7396_02845 [Streptomyces angustmyceticus]GES27872.1 hypothetical protein San01_03590 [Streptomyces angustmyceticus]
MTGTTDSDCVPREHTDSEPCGPCERRQAHAEGEHAFCGDECDDSPNPPYDLPASATSWSDWSGA